jgi:uncharacterized protein
MTCQEKSGTLPGDPDVNEAQRNSQPPLDEHRSGRTEPGLQFRSFRGGPPAALRPRIECGDLPFLIKRDGTWLYRGSPISRKELVCLFSSVLKRDESGDYWLETPAERGRIQVEETPWLAVELDWHCEGRHQALSFRTNVDQVVTASAEHPVRIAHDCLTCEPTPYITIRQGEGALPLEARIIRPVYYELVALAVPETVRGVRKLGVWSCDRFFSLGDLPPGED